MIPVPTVGEKIGAALNRIGAWGELNMKEQVVALIDEVRKKH